MKTIIAVIAIIFVGIFLKIRHDKIDAEEKKVAALENASGALKAYVAKITKERNANTVKESEPEQELGPAATAVRSFFRAWKEGRYDDMKKMMSVPPPDAEHFSERLRKATLNWRHVKFYRERPDGENWSVDFSIEMTSPESALATAALDEISNLRNLKGPFSGRQLQPLFLGIEQFSKYDVTWRVIKQGENMTVSPYPDKDTKGISVISYVMNDTIPMMRGFGMFRGPGMIPDEAAQVQQVMAFWMTFASMMLNLEKTDTGPIVKNAYRLIAVGSNNINLMGDGVKADLALGRVPQVPK